MVDFARVQNRIYYGYGKAAIRLGTTHDIYRSATGIDPLQPSNFFGSQLISVDQDLTYVKTRKYGDLLWQFLPFNGLLLQNYDFFLNSDVTYYITDIVPTDRLSPPQCMECNAVVSVTIPINNLVPGVNDYQQYNPLAGTILISNCPCAILEHGRTAEISLKLPTSVKLPYYEVYLPDFDGVVIKPGYIVTDNIGRRMAVISAERTRRYAGFRLIAGQLGV